MASLKGQNFRVLVFDETLEKFKVVAMATNCTITLNTNTEDETTKDVLGMATQPGVVSKSWQVQVETLNFTDAKSMLTAIKSLTPFKLLWDETSTTDNQTAVGATVARTGLAYLSDLSLALNDRANITKSLQFSGSGAIEALEEIPEVETIVPSRAFTKGQFVRLFLGSDNSTTPSKVIAAAQQLTFHVSMSLESATTKDTEGDWVVNEPTSLSFDISTTALTRGGDVITSSVTGQSVADIEDIYENSQPVRFQIANVSGDNQRTKGEVIVSGSVIVSSLTLNGPNRQNATYSAQLNGYGDYVVGA